MAKKQSKAEIRKSSAKELIKDVTIDGASAGAKGAAKIVGGVATANLPKAIDGVVDVVKHGVKTTKDLIRTVFNHKEWYTEYPLNGLIGLNFGVNKKLPNVMSMQYMNGTQQNLGPVSAVALDTVLTVPQTSANEWHQAIQFLYADIRSANSGAINYSIYDLERYILNIRALHAAEARMKAAYRVLSNINFYDANTPAAYMGAMGLDFITWRESAANVKEYAIKLGTIINRLYPGKFHLIERTRWMMSCGFKDSDDAKFTPYFFRPQHVLYFKDQATPVDLALANDTLSSSATGMTWSQYVNNVETLLNDLASYTVMNIIAGDILKAFGPSAIYRDDRDITAPLDFVFDQAILSQIQNATLVGNSTSTWTPAGGANTFASDTYVSSGTANFYVNSQQYINNYKDDYDAGDLLALTRLVAAYSYASGTFTVLSHGTEFCERIMAYAFNNTGNIGGLMKFGAVRYNNNTLNGTSSGMAIGYEISIFSQVDYCPAIFICLGYAYNSTSVNRYDTLPALFDLNNFAEITDLNISTYHGYAALSLIAAPRLIKQSKGTLIS